MAVMADDPLTGFVRTVVGSGTPILVLSPHLDDAVLSCGALLGWAGRRAPVTVATLFTEAAPPPYALSARQYLKRTRAGDAEELFADRRAEDRHVLERLEVGRRHVGLVDGLFRRLPRPVRVRSGSPGSCPNRPTSTRRTGSTSPVAGTPRTTPRRSTRSARPSSRRGCDVTIRAPVRQAGPVPAALAAARAGHRRPGGAGRGHAGTCAPGGGA